MNSIQLSRPSIVFAGMLFSAMLCTFFLFFVDEGYYNLQWMSDLGNWGIFFLFSFMILMFEGVIAFVASFFLSEKSTIRFCNAIACALPFALLFYIISCLISIIISS